MHGELVAMIHWGSCGISGMAVRRSSCLKLYMEEFNDVGFFGNTLSFPWKLDSFSSFFMAQQ